jgi:hypothetical protein
VGGPEQRAAADQHGQLGGVVHRRHVQDPVAVPQPQRQAGVDADPHDAVVVEQRPLGASGGARRVQDQRIVGLGDVDPGRGHGVSGGQVAQVRVPLDRVQGDRRARQAAIQEAVSRPDDGLRPAAEHQQRCAGISQNVLQLGSCRGRVYRDDQRAEPQRGVQREDEPVAVAGHEQHPVALAQPGRGEGVRRPVHGPVELSVGIAALAEDDGEAVGAPAGVDREGVRDGGHEYSR